MYNESLLHITIKDAMLSFSKQKLDYLWFKVLNNKNDWRKIHEIYVTSQLLLNTFIPEKCK